MTQNAGYAGADGQQIITMWELYGCGMEQVATAVAAELGLPLHGQAFSSDDVEAETEAREKEGTFGRWLRGLTPVASPVGGLKDDMARIGEDRSIEETARTVRADVNAFADEGGVILGRNGAFLLQGRPGALHVKLVGKLEERVARAAAISGIDPEKATRRQPIEDDFRRDLAMKLFRFDPLEDDYYDLVLDTTRFSLEECVSLIVQAAQMRKQSA
ncbi:MAG TPA: cytidylate kinase-like family protein [Propionibacterium sp.]|nr:cytidylate kinase-like family protein [Propionibacterium sp.]